MKLTNFKLRKAIREIITELDFKDQDAFKKYKSKHNMRSSTKITIAGNETTVGTATGKGKSDDISGNQTSKSEQKNKLVKLASNANTIGIEGMTAVASITGDPNYSDISKASNMYDSNKELINPTWKYKHALNMATANNPKQKKQLKALDRELFNSYSLHDVEVKIAARKLKGELSSKLNAKGLNASAKSKLTAQYDKRILDSKNKITKKHIKQITPKLKNVMSVLNKIADHHNIPPDADFIRNEVKPAYIAQMQNKSNPKSTAKSMASAVKNIVSSYKKSEKRGNEKRGMDNVYDDIHDYMRDDLGMHPGDKKWDGVMNKLTTKIMRQLSTKKTK